MRIHPRQRILDVWRSVVNASFQNGNWVWGGQDEPNSISDAEQLLCLLYPAAEITSLCLDRPDVIASDVLNTLKPLGDSLRIPQNIIRVLADYMDRYTDKDGQAIFAGGSYFRNAPQNRNAAEPLAITEEQLALDIVDAYSVSVTLCLAALGFIKVFKPLIERQAGFKAKVEELEVTVGKRLTAAMVGLLRSFAVKTVGINDPPGRVMLRMLNQAGAPESVVLEKLRRSLVRVRATLRDDVRFGVATEVGLEDDNRLFECGWSWGIVHNSPPVPGVEGILQRPGIADGRPYLYFTVVALDGINDLNSPRTRELGLLDENQRQLADSLQIRWDLTQRYWSTVARFGNQQWPLEDIPWRTSDGAESEYYSLLVSAVLVQDLIHRQATAEDLNRAVAVFEELARRGRITCRMMEKDPAVSLHVPGVPLTLKDNTGLGPQLYWSVGDFAPLLLKRSLQAARLAANVNARARLMRVAEATMDHLLLRRLAAGPAHGLWDAPAEAFFPSETRSSDGKPSWYITSRVIEGLVAAVETFEEPPLCSSNIIAGAQELLNEAEHLLDQEMLEAEADDTSAAQRKLGQIEERLRRAGQILNQRPGTAQALILKALGELDELAVARLDATRSS